MDIETTRIEMDGELCRHLFGSASSQVRDKQK